MKILLLEPPPAQRLGGLEAAVNGLRDSLRSIGIETWSSVPEGARLDDFDAVHFHGLWQPRYVRIATKLRRSDVPFVVSPHGMLEPWAWRHKAWKKWPYYFAVERPFLRRAACVLATANTEAERLSKLLPGNRIDVLPLGMTGNAGPDYEAARTVRGWSSEDRVLLFLSRIHVKKGLDLLLRALAEIEVPANARLVIVGGGDLRYIDSLKRFTSDNADRLPRVEWLGEIWGDERWSYFQGADLFCLPTHSENFGLAVLEALQVGTPVLTTRATPWADYLSDERGMLTEPCVEALKQSLDQFLRNKPCAPSARQRTAAWAHETFSWSQLAPQFRELYASLK